MDIFSRLAPFIQDYIYRNRWTELREVQVAACDVIFNTDKNLLLSTGTASGKTEAAFLPALTLLDENPSASVGILYISPLKALINDQFFRLEQLLEESGIPICKWHGDTSISAKNKLLRKPCGVLQITPESLQSLLVNRREVAIRLFSDLRFIIVDEVHYFMESPRGMQLLCILEQIQKLTDCIARRIGLSATLSDYSAAEFWLNSGTNHTCITPSVNAGTRRLNLVMKRFALQGDGSEEKEDSGRQAHYQYLYKQTLHKKAIIFAKARAEVESVIASLRRMAQENKTKDIYHVHHGSISSILREEAEKEMKLSADNIVTGATVTLELGMDIGALDRVLQVGAPFSASSFVQRIGRCGRRGQPAELLFTFEEEEIDNSTEPMHAINWDFIKTIAIIQLFLEEKWVEPIAPANFPYALLYHQTMSFLVSAGETSPAYLAQNMLSLAPFRQITKEDYQLLLRHLIEIEHIQKTERNGLIIGKNAEHIISHFDFYSVFETPAEYLVKNESESIGTVTTAYSAGSRFALAGLTWECTEINEKSKIIFVKPISGVSKISWTGPSPSDLHTRLLRKMREILMSDADYAYLSDACVLRLRQIREIVRMTSIASKLIVPLGRKKKGVFPWIGTRQLVALHFALAQKGISCSIQPEGRIPVYLAASYDGDASALEKLVLDICKGSDRTGEALDKYDFPFPEKIEIPRKFNRFIPQVLLTKQFAEDYLDVEGLKEICDLK